jgi:hypothetical protein
MKPRKPKTALERIVAQLSERVAKGERLTGAEIRILEAAASGDKPEPSSNLVQNQTALAAALGVSRWTIQRKAKEPGAPKPSANGSLNVEAWRAYLGQEGATGDDSEDEDGEESQARLKAKQILLQNEKLAFQIQVLKRNYVPVESVKEWGGAIGQRVRRALVEIPRLAPVLAGMDTAEIEERLQSAIDAAFASIHRLGDDLQRWDASKIAETDP